MNSTVANAADIRRRRLILVTIASGTFVSVLDQTGVTLALPLMASDFEATIPFVQWVGLGYILVTGSLLLPAGRLSDMIGRKVIYVGGFAVFVVGAALAAISPTLITVIIFRMMQGAGSAMIQANGMAILTTTFPDEARARVIGMFMTMVGLGAIMGPIVAGFVVDSFGWRAVFVTSVPLGAVSLAAALIVLRRETPSISSVRQLASGFDWVGAGLSSAGLVVFLLVMTNAYRVGWHSPLAISAMGLSVGLLTIFVLWERRCSQPMLDIQLFSRRIFAFGVSASFFAFLAGSSMFSMMPFYLQDVLNVSPRVIGLLITPAAIGFAVSGPIAAFLADAVGSRRIEFAGLAMIALSLLFMGTLTVETEPWKVSAAMAVQGLGMGLFYTPNTATVLGVVEHVRYGVATAFLNMTRNTANAAGVGLVITVVTMAMAARGFEPSLDAVKAGGVGVDVAFTVGLRIAFLALGGLIGISILLTYLKPASSPASEDQAPMSEPEAQPSGN